MDEILVHISTPATRQYDDLYQALADAYLDFKPHQSNVVDGPESGNEQDDSIAAELKTAPPDDGGSTIYRVAVSLSTTSKDPYGSFPSQMSPENSHKSLELPSFRCSLVSMEEDSLPPMGRLGQLELIQKNWRKRKEKELAVFNEQRPGGGTFISSRYLSTTFIDVV